MSAGNYADAVVAFGEVVDSATGKDSKSLALEGRAEALKNLRRYDQAMSDLSAALALWNGDECGDNVWRAEILNLRARVFVRAESDDLALAEYAAALDALKMLRWRQCDTRSKGASESLYVSIYQGRGRTYRILKNEPAAMSDILSALSHDKNNVPVLMDLGDLQVTQGHCSDAIDTYTRVLSSDSNHTEALLRRAECWSDLKQFESALSDSKQLMQAEPNNPFNYIFRASVFKSMHEYAHADDDASRAIELRSDLDNFYSLLCEIRAQQRRFTEAGEDCDRAIALDPRYAGGYSTRGKLFRMQGRMKEALTDFTAAIALERGTLHTAQLERAFAYAQMDNVEAALADLNAVYDQHSDRHKVVFFRGWLFLQIGDAKRALVDFARARSLEPDDPYVYLWEDIAVGPDIQAAHSADGLARIDAAKWPAPILQLYAGSLSPSAVFQAARDTDPDVQQVQLCEANFYVAAWLLQRTRSPEAPRSLKLAVENCPVTYLESVAAKLLSRTHGARIDR